MSAAVSIAFKPQIQSRVHYDAYRAMPGDSITRLKEMKRSPLHYRHALKNPKESRPLTFGKAIHVAVLEPERFDRDHAVWGRRTESGNLGPRKGKAWDEFACRAQLARREIITEDEYNGALVIQKAVRDHAGAMRYLAAGEPEVTMTATLRGRICKGRADWLTTVDGLPVLVGLKSARDCRPFIFGSAAAKLGYHLQWAFYRDIYEQIRGHIPRVVEIVVESAPPHDIAVYNVPDDVMEQGREEYEALLDRLAECERDNHWPGAVEGEQFLTLPSWAYESTDDLSDLGLELGAD
jgi:hypothetical protein